MILMAAVQEVERWSTIAEVMNSNPAWKGHFFFFCLPNKLRLKNVLFCTMPFGQMPFKQMLRHTQRLKNKFLSLPRSDNPACNNFDLSSHFNGIFFSNFKKSIVPLAIIGMLHATQQLAWIQNTPKKTIFVFPNLTFAKLLLKIKTWHCDICTVKMKAYSSGLQPITIVYSCGNLQSPQLLLS